MVFQRNGIRSREEYNVTNETTLLTYPFLHSYLTNNAQEQNTSDSKQNNVFSQAQQRQYKQRTVSYMKNHKHKLFKTNFT